MLERGDKKDNISSYIMGNKEIMSKCDKPDIELSEFILYYNATIGKPLIIM